MEFSLAQNYKPYYVKQLQPSNREFQKLRNFMQGEYLIRINQIFAIENPYLYDMFEINYNAYKSYNKNTQILELFHSTDVDNVESIIEYNFDWRLAKRVKYGCGVSFSPYPDYANMHSSLGKNVYCKDGPAVLKAMFVVDVLVGNKQIGNKHTVMPKWPNDTTVNNNETVFVKYRDNEFYPKYVINYISYPVVSVQGHRYLIQY